MPTNLTHDQLLALARQGAQARLKELRQEIAAIEEAFKDAGSTRRITTAGQATAVQAPTKGGRNRASSRMVHRCAEGRCREDEGVLGAAEGWKEEIARQKPTFGLGSYPVGGDDHR